MIYIVVPAKAGTHNHNAMKICEAVPPMSEASAYYVYILAQRPVTARSYIGVTE